ncbi:uncharacterized protein LOC121372099 [Gigantopelta aegis]|uniref:uncharacterized protein LOC121372099 n=1 Tax=Gigantopelta aegis TaxID=1735272 RepID=UPI001B888E70|nr:uncharacterized protein LOC121372099 [Gigantopelta aegis]
MLLSYVALMVMLAIAVNGNGQNQWMGPRYYWPDWENEEECSVLCGSGLRPQIQRATCYKRLTCYPEYMPSPHRRNVTCNTQPCGDTCPPGVDQFLPHPTNTHRFYQCAFERAVLHHCPAPLVWGQDLGRCAWTWEV